MNKKIWIALSILTFVFFGCTTALTEDVSDLEENISATSRVVTQQITNNGVEFTLDQVSSTTVKVRTVDGIGGAASAQFTLTIYTSSGSIHTIVGSTYFNLVKNVSKTETYGLPTGGSASITYTNVVR